MLEVNCRYRIEDDIVFILEAEKMNSSELAERTGISRTTLDAVAKTGAAQDSVLEKLYSFIYKGKYRINAVKEELLKEKYHCILFHGSKNGLTAVTPHGSRENCDFGNGFYLGETYSQALSFVCEHEKSSVYSFRYNLDGLAVKRFECDLDWMLAICYFRGTLKTYAQSERVKQIAAQVDAADVVIAPIADNKMFYIMAQFTDGDINCDAALHSLSASKLGYQYVFKTEEALRRLAPVERYYLSKPEREDCIRLLKERGYEIDTKLKLAKREFRTGLYIEELL